MRDINYWINLKEFSPYELIVTSIGWIFWITLYILIIKKIREEKYVEMPWICALGNISWEFTWGFFFYQTINLGEFFVWSYRAWFFLDIYILWGVFKYGKKQIDIPEIKQYFNWLVLAVIAIWIALYATFIASGFDHKWGSQSAYISNVVISTLFITLFLRQWRQRKFSKLMAWCKCLGTLAYTIVYFNFDFPNIFVHVIGGVVFLLDISYLIMLYKMQGKNWKVEEQIVNAA
ncbi:hypothetical protein K6119_00750 [Paracrocinitomix mangrovi]|uniref:transmembrane-type terpene cyclase n=1 Tax=Paracrocinitomix mangrovi TaxID=2862509 RepID=UPI001C8E2855|nr:hypothetical protein [Paracrocinitomix mangrovi]UKN02042.1 hypothetical protein K6119_00750 [Paracrocinitomix mangrovi]